MRNMRVYERHVQQKNSNLRICNVYAAIRHSRMMEVALAEAARAARIVAAKASWKASAVSRLSGYREAARTALAGFLAALPARAGGFRNLGFRPAPS